MLVVPPPDDVIVVLGLHYLIANTICVAKALVFRLFRRGWIYSVLQQLVELICSDSAFA